MGALSDIATLRRIGERECLKYSRLHANGYGVTGYQNRMSTFVARTSRPKDRFLDLGCGRGVAVEYLLLQHRDATGVDITLEGRNVPHPSISKVVVNSDRFVEAPLWTLPFSNGEFDYSFSTDVMEHIPPELVDNVIKEIYRVTNRKTLHVVYTEPSEYEPGLHLTVRSIEWWRKAFEQYNARGVETTIVDFTGFTQLWNKQDRLFTKGVRNGKGKKKTKSTSTTKRTNY